MSLDLDNLAPAPDIDNFDPKGLDRGDALVANDPVIDPVEEPEPKAANPVEEPEPAEEPTADPVKEPEEQPRDEKGKFAGIPKARFDEAVGKERELREAAERRAVELERQLANAEQSKVKTAQLEELEAGIVALEKKHADLLIDGNVEGAAAVMREIRLSERQIARAEAATLSSQQTSQALESERFDTAVARLEADYPLLNPKSDTYDEDLVGFVLSKQRDLMTQEGLSPSQALTKAAVKVMDRFGKQGEPVADKEGLANAKVVEDRKQAQVKKNLDTLAKQPANLKESGIDSDKAGQTGKLPDVTTMTSEEFDALPASMKSRMRGDLI